MNAATATAPTAAAHGAIYGLIPQAMMRVGAIEKNRKNPQQGYNFRGIDDVYSAVHGIFAELGIFCAPTVLDKAREERTTAKGTALIYTILTVQHRFYAYDGSFVDVVTVGEAMDSGDKSANKAMSAAMKYAVIELLAIPTEADNDTENHSHEVQTKAQQEAVALAREMRLAMSPADLGLLVERAKFLPEQLRSDLREVYSKRMAEIKAGPKDPGPEHGIATGKMPPKGSA
jgi:hypothetical protein